MTLETGEKPPISTGIRSGLRGSPPAGLRSHQVTWPANFSLGVAGCGTLLKRGKSRGARGVCGCVRRPRRWPLIINGPLVASRAARLLYFCLAFPFPAQTLARSGSKIIILWKFDPAKERTPAPTLARRAPECQIYVFFKILRNLIQNSRRFSRNKID